MHIPVAKQFKLKLNFKTQESFLVKIGGQIQRLHCETNTNH